eukprot:CAMPEP_0201606844 /NCGR_PEP_ID=MMETSP0492-20130828/6166_1 /ASSEMBLY_ACC=CAM_ASM_000837 /TAXON_ID=420259 /ORGANISM="Thalassiosira gravida, Strain GMp14c1" /LENGTH=124 /DNA_ID=CAMNT_0048071337 /DNA_START=117 /DNA_END=491 /DNA_ORIENTATION=-
MTLIVEVHVDFEVMMKYLALKWRCMEVKALATTLAFAAPSTYDSNLEPDPVPCCTSPTFNTTLNLGNSFPNNSKNSSHALLSSLVTITFSINGSNSKNFLTPSIYVGKSGQSNSPFADPVILCP